jgi:hypothetical protein
MFAERLEVPVDDMKKAGRNIATATKRQARKLDGHQLGDDIGNAGDEIRKDLGNAGDEIRKDARNAGDHIRREGEAWRDEPARHPR